MATTFPFSVADGVWSCGLCPKTIETVKKSLIVYHKNTHYPKYACESCDKMFPQKSRLDVHVRTAHTGEKPYVCAKCEKAFFQLSNLNDHVKKNHLGDHGDAATVPRKYPGAQFTGVVAC